MDILCKKNLGYIWTINSKKGYFKGYLQLKDGNVLEGNNALDYLYQSLDFENFKQKLTEIYGCFAVIVTKENKLWAAVDIARTIPLYYASDLSVISDSGEEIRKHKKIKKSKVEPLRLLELYATSNIVFENTAYSEIKQIDCGNAVEIICNKIQVDTYFTHTSKLEKYTESEAICRLDEISQNMIKRTLQYINGRPIALSLSGGYDSRYIACTLKNAGIDNVICYTYGSSKSNDIKESKLVADALGYEWHCVYYTDKEIQNLIDGENESYFKYCYEHDYTLYLQNFLAIKKMTDAKLLPHDAVFLTGLGNDMPTGVYVPSKKTAKLYGFSLKGVCNYIIDYRFSRIQLNQKIHDKFAYELENYLLKSKIQAVTNYQTFVNATDCAQAEEAHSRYYPNMNRIHEFFGYKWVMPCWDKELIQFWYSIPVELRYKRNLFEKYVTQNLGSKYNVGQKRWVAVSQKNQILYKTKRKLAGILVKVLYPLGIPIKRSTDENNFAPLEVLFYKKIRQKNAIKAQRAAITMLMNIYIMEKKYGYKWYKSISGMLKK